MINNRSRGYAEFLETGALIARGRKLILSKGKPIRASHRAERTVMDTFTRPYRPRPQSPLFVQDHYGPTVSEQTSDMN